MNRLYTIGHSNKPFEDLVEQMLVRRIPKSVRDEEGVLKLCGLNHEAIARKAARMLGVVGV